MIIILHFYIFVIIILHFYIFVIIILNFYNFVIIILLPNLLIQSNPLVNTHSEFSVV